MPRLIDADNVNWGTCPVIGYAMKEWLAEQPTIEAEPVMHGRWIEEIEFGCDGSPNGCHFRCSICNEIEYETTPYCPNCGARMDGDTHA